MKNKKRYAENIEETRKRLKKNEEIPEELLMAVEFGRFEVVHTTIANAGLDNSFENDLFHDRKTYKCTLDGCDFQQTEEQSWRGLINHMAMHTRVRNMHQKANGLRTDFNCPYCKRIFGTVQKLLRHVEGKRCRENNSDKSNKEKFKEILNENW